MYCFKCGRKNSGKATVCRECHTPLAEKPKPAVDRAPRTKAPSRQEAKAAKEQRRREALKQKRDEAKQLAGEAAVYRQDCLLLCNTQHKEQLQRISELYDPKIAAATNAETREELLEDREEALADEIQRYDTVRKKLESPAQAAKALVDMRRYAGEAGVTIPPRNDSVASHAFVQYVHKRDDRVYNQRERGLCFLIVGLILLIVGVIFFYLSYKVSTDPEINEKIIRFDSFEFWVCMFGLSLGSSSFGYGLVAIAMSIVQHLHFQNAIIHFRIAHRLFQ